MIAFHGLESTMYIRVYNYMFVSLMHCIHLCTMYMYMYIVHEHVHVHVEHSPTTPQTVNYPVYIYNPKLLRITRDGITLSYDNPWNPTCT